MPDTVETTWDQLPELLRQRLQRFEQRQRNRHVKMMIFPMPDEDVVVIAEGAQAPAKRAASEQWVRQLRAWVDSQPRLSHVIDDSREGIYNEVVRDPR